MINQDIARIFTEIAYLLEAAGEQKSQFEANAYLKASRAISSMQEDLETIYEKGGKDALLSIPGIGKGIADKIVEYINSGSIQKYEDLKKKYPIDFISLMKIEGLGPKKLAVLYQALGITNVEELRNAILNHKVRGIPGFGEKSENQLLKNIEMAERVSERIPIWKAYPEALRIKNYLESTGYALIVEIAGSTRRMKETIGDIDILAASEYPNALMDKFVEMDGVSSIIAKGDKKSTVSLKIGTTCDLRIVSKESFGAAMQYFTGSKDHNIKLRRLAIGKGMKLNEYGLFSGDKNIVSGMPEEKVYETLDLAYIPPELREDRGEIEAAAQKRLPEIVQYGEVKGDMFSKMDVSNIKNITGISYVFVDSGDGPLTDLYMYTFDGGRAVKTGASIKALDCSKLNAVSELKSASGVIMLYNIDSLGLPESAAVQNLIEKLSKSGIIVLINSSDVRPTSDFLYSLRKYDFKVAIGSFSDEPSLEGSMRFGIGITRRAWIEKNRIINTLDANALMSYLKNSQ
ncbi:DNA-dependent DNA polymerase family X [Thermoplasma volcanium GSS1]|uniref:DNA polymerase beta n=1 Tax=Thermoplasma volcanium (strain ATCC 51530 / DSM 4299 / JCM 9571 / NBRC 15438 / GSS1) TaxID=273116 RepID=Q97AE0_THEVO|nr:helix-hairpin-helix domain-containing protein [Thermoplasma volcanium]BAB60012.1 DNA-dependent DNA polymerase family X [Thermoplasma volcanium GSS1]